MDFWCSILKYNFFIVTIEKLYFDLRGGMIRSFYQIERPNCLKINEKTVFKTVIYDRHIHFSFQIQNQIVEVLVHYLLQN